MSVSESSKYVFHRMASHGSYKILPAHVEDTEDVFNLLSQAFKDDPLSKHRETMLQSEESRAKWLESRKKRTRKMLEENSGEVQKPYRMQFAKVVYTPDGNDMVEDQTVAFACWTVPLENAWGAHDEMREVDDDSNEDLRRVQELNRGFDEEAGLKSREVIGELRHSHYWYLAALATSPEHQKRGLGSKLVEWGLAQARADAVARPGQIKGLWTVATPAGLRTYKKAGMKEVGDYTVDYGLGPGGNGQKFVWLLQKFDEG